MKLSKYLLGALIEAVFKDDADVVKPLVDFGADPNGFEDKDALRPLHYAVIYRSLESASALIECGANCNVRDRDGLSPVERAKSLKLKDFVSLFNNVKAKGGCYE